MKTQVKQRVSRMGLYGLVGLSLLLWTEGRRTPDRR